MSKVRTFYDTKVNYEANINKYNRNILLVYSGCSLTVFYFFTY